MFLRFAVPSSGVSLRMGVGLVQGRNRTGRSLARLASHLTAALFATALVALPATPAAAACPAPAGGALPALPDASGEIVFRGRGWGHGTGMSQYGARGAADLGCTHAEILSTYYPGTTLSGRASEVLRVNLGRDAVKQSVFAVSGDVTWERCGADRRNCQTVHVQPSRSTWIVRIQQDGVDSANRPVPRPATYVVQRLSGSSWVDVAEHPEDTILRVRLSDPASDTLGPQVRVDDGVRPFSLARGIIEYDAESAGANDMFINLLLGMEPYLYGLGEMPSSWHVEALRAQAVAARTYAYQRVDARGGSSRLGLVDCRCHLYATTADQNYIGYAKEAESGGSRWVDSVRRTGNQIVTFDGRPIEAYYSSVHGGASESYRFWSGGTDRPYLRPVDDSAWEARGGSPLSAWVVSTTAARLGQVLGVGRVTAVRLADPKGLRGRIGRPDVGFGGVVVEGTTGRWEGSGDRLRSALRALGDDCHRRSGQSVQRLCSTMFTVEVRLGDQAPTTPSGVVPPPAGAVRLVGDWNGDGVPTPGWFKDGQWGMHDRLDGTGTTTLLQYGQRGDVPVVGDWDGDGVDTVGVVRGNLWILRNEYRRGADDIVMRYGEPSDVKVVGDWDGNGTDTLGVVRGNLWILRNVYRRGADDIVMRYGEPSDVKVVGDWDGNGTDTLGIVRGDLWVLRNRYVSGARDVTFRY
jgi:peptidoglycan hydrolase-like amidase